MLRKLLKYDFKSVLRYWWIAALTSLILSLLGGGCITVLASDREFPAALYVCSVFVLIMVIFSYAIFTTLSMILIFIRFYRNFFTDEGYLTFTLPVKRSQLLNSKLIMSIGIIIATYIVLILNIIIMLAIGFSSELFSKSLWYSISYYLETFTEGMGWYLVLYIIEFFIFIILSTAFSVLFLFCCITFASIITKKAKVITAIGIYYGANSIVSFVFQIFYLFGIGSLSNWLYHIPVAYENGVVALIMFGILLFMAIFCMLLYLLQYWMLDRKLNLN